MIHAHERNAPREGSIGRFMGTAAAMRSVSAPTTFEVDENGIQWRHPEIRPDTPYQPFNETGYISYIRSLFNKEIAQRICVGSVDLEVIEATNLPAADFGGLSDPYCVLELSGKYGEYTKKQREWEISHRINAKTHVEVHTLEPKWYTSGLHFQIPRHGAMLKVDVYDHDEIAADDPLGHLVINFNELAVGIHEGWWKLEEPGKSGHGVVHGGDVQSGPAIKLRIDFKVHHFGEFCSFLWNAPPLIAPPITRFEPNIFFGAMFEFKNKVISNISIVGEGISDAVFWKRGPSYTFLVLTLALLFCQNINNCWIIMHLFFACFVLFTGILTRWGQIEELKWPNIFKRLLKVPITPTTPPKQLPSPSSSSSSMDKMASLEEEQKASHHHHINLPFGHLHHKDPTPPPPPQPLPQKKLFTGLTEITLRKAGRMVGKPMGMAQQSVIMMMKSVDQLEGLILWSRKDYKMGFKNKDGPFMAFGFICANLFMVFVHFTIEFRFIAMIGIFFLFSMVFLLPMSNLLPQALKLSQNRSKLKKLQKPLLNINRPAPSRAKRQSRKSYSILLSKIFHRVDIDHSGTVTVDELLDALSDLEENKKELIRELHHEADEDGSGELNEIEFETLVMSQGGVMARPLVIAELKLQLQSKNGVRIKKLPSHASSSLWYLFSSPTKKTNNNLKIRSQQASPNSKTNAVIQSTRAHSSSLRINSNKNELCFLKRNINWFLIPRSNIIKIENDIIHPTMLHIEYIEIGSSSNLAILSFDAEAETVCEALIAALVDLLKLPPQASSSSSAESSSAIPTSSTLLSQRGNSVDARSATSPRSGSTARSHGNGSTMSVDRIRR